MKTALTTRRAIRGASRPAALLSCAFLSLSATANSQSVIHQFTGAASGNRLGTCVAILGDIDGDRIDDVAVGAIVDPSTGLNSGVVRIYSGASGAEVHTIRGSSSLDFFGNSCAAAGDVDGDGRADVIIGAPFADPGGTSSGQATVHSGLDGSLIWTFDGDAANDQLGYSVGGAGDVNGDGFDDLLVGAWLADSNGLDSGRARVFSGADGTMLYEFDGTSLGDNLGFSVAGAGDVNRDGFADVIVGAYRSDQNGDQAGSAFVYSGVDGTLLWTILGDDPRDRLGYSVAGVGDVDRDGFADVGVGITGDDSPVNNAGGARIVSGATGLTLLTVNGDASGDDFGNSVAGAGDVNSDGHADFMVGAFSDADNGPDAGSAVVFSGFDGSVLASITNSTQNDRLGWSVAGGGDLDGDFFPDVVSGARGEDPGGTVFDAGAAYVYDLGFAGAPWQGRNYGSSCIGGNGRLPRIRMFGQSKIGETIGIQVSGAAENSTATLFIGDPIAAIPLDVIGLIGCSLYVSSFIDLAIPTDANGMAAFVLPLANEPGLAGQTLDFQYATLDFAAPYAVPLTFTGGLSMLMGN